MADVTMAGAIRGESFLWFCADWPTASKSPLRLVWPLAIALPRILRWATVLPDTQGERSVSSSPLHEATQDNPFVQ